jgi:hypothetical protein
MIHAIQSFDISYCIKWYRGKTFIACIMKINLGELSFFNGGGEKGIIYLW